MAADPRIESYAAALFEVATGEGSLETVEDELFKVARTIEGSDDLRSTLTDENIPLERRLGVVADVFRTAHPTTMALVSFVVAANRTRDLPAIIDRLFERAAAERSEVVAEVRVAIELTDDQRRRLADALSTRTGRRVSVKVVRDPSVLGGVLAQVEDLVIDGTVRSRLNQLRETL